MGKPKRLALIVLLGVLAWPLGATTTEVVDVECPVCANKFRALEWASTNTVGGQDRDFLSHAAGTQVFLIVCWTCPKCRYTGFSNDFSGEEVPRQLIDRLKKENPLKAPAAIDPKLKDTWKIPGWVRFDLYAQTKKLVDGTKPGVFSISMLRAAWSQRFGLWELPGLEKRRNAVLELVKNTDRDGYERAMKCARALEKLVSTKDESLSEEDRPLALVLAATYYKSRGEDPDAVRVLEGLKDTKLEETLQAAVADLRKRVEIEKTYLRRALPHLRAEAGADGMPPGAVASIQYLRGVIHRKLGDAKRALELLEPLQDDKRLGKGVRDWVRDELRKLKTK